MFCLSATMLLQDVYGLSNLQYNSHKLNGMQQTNDMNEGQQQVSMPVKVSDSIFMGDDIIAHDIEWLSLNQITHIINCAGRHSHNNTVIKGMCFLTFDWAETNIQNMIDQNVINAVVGFVEEAKRDHGTVLVHGWHSESRPFCLLAIYFMIKYQWNLYKALEYLNSRREGTQVDEVFIHQLNTLHARLIERGLIRSKQWIIGPQTTDEQVILTNTFLNSRRKQGQQPPKQTKKKKKSSKTVVFKQNLSTQHIYSQNSVIAQIISGFDNVGKTAVRFSEQSQGRVIRKEHNGEDFSGQADYACRQNEFYFNGDERDEEVDGAEGSVDAGKGEPASKLPHMYFQPNTEVPRSADTPLYVRKQQKINDRLQDKISILKSQTQNQEPRPLQPQTNKDTTLAAMIKKGKDLDPSKKQKESKKQSLIGLLTSEQGKDSRIVHNNWIINNQVLKDTSLKNQKQTSSKSVIVVKPNHALQPSESQQSQQRGSVRKAGSQRKPQKQQASKKFFGQESIVAERGRCNSVKQQRKEGLGSSVIMKNSSLTGKGKWKL